jgi:predicted acetyltransferase
LEDRETIARLLNDYLRELASHRERPVGATDSAEYPYLDGYFSEPGLHPFVIRRQGVVVGFALIRAPKSTGRAWEVAEFYVVPESRREGVGGAALASIWRRFPGDWELQVHRRNDDAVRFWLSCVKRWVNRDPEVEEVEAADGRRLQLRFRVD